MVKREYLYQAAYIDPTRNKCGICRKNVEGAAVFEKRKSKASKYLITGTICLDCLISNRPTYVTNRKCEICEEQAECYSIMLGYNTTLFVCKDCLNGLHSELEETLDGTRPNELDLKEVYFNKK